MTSEAPEICAAFDSIFSIGESSEHCARTTADIANIVKISVKIPNLFVFILLLLARYPLRILGVKIDNAVQTNFDFINFIPKLKNRIGDREIKFERRESVREFRARRHRETHEGFFIFKPRRNKMRAVGRRAPALFALGVGRARIEGFQRFV